MGLVRRAWELNGNMPLMGSEMRAVFRGVARAT